MSYNQFEAHGVEAFALLAVVPAVMAVLPVEGVGAFELPAVLDIMLGHSCCVCGVCEFQ